MSKKFKLSSVLYGHSLDVRCVHTTRDNSIISGSRDKTAKMWKTNGISPGYSEVMAYKDQKNFVIAVTYLEPSEEHPEGLVITGGNDNIIYVYKPSEPFASLTLKEHTNAVSCLTPGLDSKMFLSGSWDSCTKIWTLDRLPNSNKTLSGHSAAIWSVVQLKNSKIVTASADKTIIMWTTAGDKLTTLKGHKDCVRALVDLPESETFISASNDASIIKWNYQGDILETLYGHTNYIYSAAKFPNGDFASSDEDRTIRLWTFEGNSTKNFETIKLPAQSVWSVATLTNGDLVAGSSDGVIRIFTQNEEKFADDVAMKNFTEEVEAMDRQNMQEIGGYKVSDLPGKEALYDPGKRPGQIKMIRENNGVVAYTWVDDGDNSHWEKTGEVLGSTEKTKEDKTLFEGKPYDFVFSVDVEDGKPALKLPFNRGEDPYRVANEFLARNFLPPSYLETVVDFILKNTQESVPQLSSEFVDPFTGASRYTPAFTGPAGSKVSPYFPQKIYKVFDLGDPQVVLKKLKEFNQKLLDDGSKLDDVYLESVVGICNGSPNDPNTFDYLFKLLEWPDDIIFPVIDVVRMSVRDRKSNQVITSVNQGIIIEKLKYFINENCKIKNNLIVSLRALCNLFSHEFGEELVFSNRYDLVEMITSLSTLPKSGQTALSTFLLNLTIATMKRNDDLTKLVLAQVLPDISMKLDDAEGLFRSFVAIGTLLTDSSTEILDIIKGNNGFTRFLQLNSLNPQNELELKKSNCAKQVIDLLK